MATMKNLVEPLFIYSHAFVQIFYAFQTSALTEALGHRTGNFYYLYCAAEESEVQSSSVTLEWNQDS